MNKFFLDAAYTVALSAVTDKYHQKAEILAKQIETEAIPLKHESSYSGNRECHGKATIP